MIESLRIPIIEKGYSPVLFLCYFKFLIELLLKIDGLVAQNFVAADRIPTRLSFQLHLCQVFDHVCQEPYLCFKRLGWKLFKTKRVAKLLLELQDFDLFQVYIFFELVNLVVVLL